MKVLIIGLGSIGQRHARNLIHLVGDRLELLAWRTTNHAVPDDLSSRIRVLGSLDAALSERPDAVFICNPSSLHISVAQAAAECGCALFIEKPISDTWTGVDQLIATVERHQLVAMLGYQWRFHSGLRRLRELLGEGAIGRAIGARLDFGEYLPGWHPDEDYRSSYAARRHLGGGVLLSQIHEFDYLGWLWGMPRRLYASGGHLTSLEVDVEDFVVTQLDYGDDASIRTVTVYLDYLRRPAVRSCEVIGEDGCIALNLLDGRLVRTAPDGAVSVEHNPFVRNDLFIQELRHFLSCLSGSERPSVTIREGAMSLRLALAARQSLETRRPVDFGEHAAIAG